MKTQIEELEEFFPKETAKKIKLFVYNSFLSEDKKRLEEFIEIIKELGTPQISDNQKCPRQKNQS